ncbi:Syntaxin-6 [Physocladia obscura]|uniref:Syntaxin-6 n=1 Tax=Physocladia obscura TaxID=109957 RepID=A0AAD5SP80_9FUNG|nr:Syntaxin-6 [Physocladia obscura]
MPIRNRTVRLKPTFRKTHNINNRTILPFTREIEQDLSRAQQLHTNLRRLQNLGSTATSVEKQSELIWTHGELSTAVANITEDLTDLASAVTAVAANPVRFNLDASAVAQRKDFVARTRRELDEINTTLTRKRAVSAQPQASNSLAPPPSTHPNSKSTASSPKSDRDLLLGNGGKSRSQSEQPRGLTNDKFMDRENGVQQVIMKEQNQQLESVATTVSNMKEIAIVMNQELEDQTAFVTLPWRKNK